MSITRRCGFLATALVLLATASCLSRSSPRFLIQTDRTSQEIRIDVVNDNFLDMTIYVVREAANLRLGDVVGKTSESFSLNPDQISLSRGVMLMADPIGSRGAFISNAVTADPGSWVVFNIGATLSQSFITMR